MHILRTEQFKALEASANERFVDAMVVRLRQDFPVLPDGVAGPALKAAVAGAMAQAGDAYGLVSERDVARYLDLCATYGWQFDTTPQHQWMAEVLSDPAVTSPGERLSLLLDMCAARAKQEDHTRALADAFGIVTPVSPGATGAPPLAAADAAAYHPPGTTVQPCPGPLKSALEVMVRDTTGAGVAGVAVAIAREQAGEVRLKTGANGVARLDGLVPGNYSLSLPELDADTWKADGADTLPGHENSEPEPVWAQPAPGRPEPVRHQVGEGDCIDSLAIAHGLLPDTLWNLPANAPVRERGHARNILFPGNPQDPDEGPADTVVIPAVRPRSMVVSPGMRYRLCHLALPEYLRIQFIDADGEARAGVPYLLVLDDGPGSPLLSVEGVTDADGRLVEPIPAGATLGSVTLCKGSLHRTIELGIGYLDPVSTVTGVQDRLANLGYGCGGDDGVAGDATRWALQRFQAANGLPVSGTIDDGTRAALEKMHLG